MFISLSTFLLHFLIFSYFILYTVFRLLNPLYVLLGALLLLCYLLMNIQTYQLNQACVSFLVMKLINQKWYLYFNFSTNELICFLECSFLDTVLLILHEVFCLFLSLLIDYGRPIINQYASTTFIILAHFLPFTVFRYTSSHLSFQGSKTAF